MAQFHTKSTKSNAQNATISEPYTSSDMSTVQHTSLPTGKTSDDESINVEETSTNQRHGNTSAPDTS